MTKIKAIFSAIAHSLAHSWQRYPEALIFAYCFGLLTIARIHSDNAEWFFGLSYDHLMIVVATAVPLFLTIAAFSERLVIDHTKRLIADAAGLLLIIILYISLPDALNAPAGFRITVLNVSLYLLFTLIPFLWRVPRYDVSVIGLVARVSTTILYSVVLVLGLFAIYASIDGLLGIDVDQKVYLDTLALIVTIFAPTYFLGDIAKPSDVAHMVVDRLFERLFVYIVMPLLLIYSLILYIYFGRIVFSWTLPSNMIVHMVMWYGLISIITIFFSASYWQDYALGRWFYRYMPIVLTVPLAMLWLSLSMRIAQYGFTVQRYFVLAMSLWLSATTLYFIIRRKRHYQYIVIAAIVVMLVSMYGPINAFNVSFNSQYHRLVDLLQQNNMLVDNHIVANANASEGDRREIIECIRYFGRNDDLARVPFLPPDFNIYNDTTALLGFNYPNAYDAGQDRRYYSLINGEGVHAYDIGDAKRLYVIDELRNQNNDRNYSAVIDDDLMLTITLKDGAAYQFALADLAARSYRKNELPSEQRVVTQHGSSARARIFVQELSGNYDINQDIYYIYHLRCILLTP